MLNYTAAYSLRLSFESLPRDGCSMKGATNKIRSPVCNIVIGRERERRIIAVTYRQKYQNSEQTRVEYVYPVEHTRNGDEVECGKESDGRS